MNIRRAILAVIVAFVSPAHAQSPDDEFSKNIVATFEAGEWKAQAAEFKDYSYSPQIGCRMFTPGAMLLQTRRRESGQLDASLFLVEDQRSTGDNFEVDWIRVGGIRYEATVLPWRLAAPSPDGIVLTFDRAFLAVRRSQTSEWLPATYLTLQLLEAKRFEVGFHSEVDDHVTHGRRVISLLGFKPVSKWCGRELLRDRQDQNQVRELTK